LSIICDLLLGPWNLFLMVISRDRRLLITIYLFQNHLSTPAGTPAGAPLLAQMTPLLAQCHFWLSKRPPGIRILKV